MVVIEVSVEQPWPDGDWEALARSAIQAAVAASPYGDLAGSPTTIEVSVRLTSDAEVRALNHRYRGKDRATNVLSFPMVQPDLIEAVSANSDDGEVLLGDIVLACETTAREADEKGFALEAHATHLIVHGLLHLLGMDHERGEDHAEAMEEVERAALGRLGLPDPYRH